MLIKRMLDLNYCLFFYVLYFMYYFFMYPYIIIYVVELRIHSFIYLIKMSEVYKGYCKREATTFYLNKDSTAVYQVLGNERENYEQKTIFFDNMSAKKRAERHM